MGLQERLCVDTDSVVSVRMNGVRRDVFATGSWDQSVRVWREREDGPIAVMEDAEGSVWSVTWSGDGRRLVSGSIDRGV